MSDRVRDPAARDRATRGDLVSVVMPFLNAASFIEESVASVTAQTYPHWELLLCDDGSSDGSRALAEAWARRDPERIRVLAHPGGGTRGASAARNLGLDAARGDYVAFLDADDVWLPQKLAEQVALLERTPEADALVGSTELWYGWTGDPADVARDHILRIGVPHGSFWPPPTFLARRLRGRTASPATCSLIVRRSAVLRAGGFEESFRTVYTDQAFYLKLFLDSSLLVVDTCWDRYRQHAASACNSTERAGRMRDAYRAYLQWAREYVELRGRPDPGVRSALRFAEWSMRNPRATVLWRRARHGYYGATRLLRRWLGLTPAAPAGPSGPPPSRWESTHR